MSKDNHTQYLMFTKSQKQTNLELVHKNMPEKEILLENTSYQGVNKNYYFRINKTGKIIFGPSVDVVANFLGGQKKGVYIQKTKEWEFFPCDYHEVVNILKKANLTFNKLPKHILDICLKIPDEDDPILQGDIYDKLMPFQKDGVKFGIKKQGRVLLADEMGLGKTIQALAIAFYYHSNFPLLIIAPASLIHEWESAVSKFLNIRGIIIKNKVDLNKINSVSIISYNLATTLYTSLNQLNYKVIICDECHYLKSLKSKRTKELIPILQNTLRLIMISGTPALSRPCELFPILHCLNKKLFRNFNEYGTRYCDGKKVNGYMDYKGCSNSDELIFLLEKEIMIRRNKNDILTNLPPKRRKHIILHSNSTIDYTISNKTAYYGNTVEDDVIKAYKLAAEIKQESVINYIKKMITNNDKFLVFAHHQTMINELENCCQNCNIYYIRIDGRTGKQKRHELVELFQTNTEYQVAILSLTAASTGLTLTAAKSVVFAELYWNPGTLMQAEDRIHRIGQTTPVDIYYLICKKTIDEIFWPYLLKKLNILEKIGMSTNTFKKADKILDNQKTLDEFLK